MNNAILIEVKTKWKESNNAYSRQIITYEVNNNHEYKDESLHDRFLVLNNTYEESVDYIESNELEIEAINKETGEIIDESSAFINMLKRFTKYRYEIED